ncbi:hypothetical protein LguiB_009070 [Lonicera macranthoides]
MANLDEHHLPEDILVKILLNRPVKSLLHFKCMQKWLIVRLGGIPVLVPLNHAALWNPTTTEFKPLLDPNANLPPRHDPHLDAFGFYWDPSTNDYMVSFAKARNWKGRRDLSSLGSVQKLGCG